MSFIKQLFGNLKKREVYSAFKDNFGAADLADMQVISKFNKGFRFLLCVIDIYSKYAWFVLLKDKKGVSIVNALQSILKKSNRKPNKIWVHKGSEFYNSHSKKWLKDNSIEMYSTHNEGKSVVAERFIRIIKNKIYRYMTSISKNVYIDKLDDIVHKYDNKKHRTVKMKPIDVKDNTYIDFGKEVSANDPNLRLVIMQEYQNTKTFLLKAIVQIDLKKFLSFVQFHGHMLLIILIVKKLLEDFMKKEVQKIDQQELRIKR